MRAKNSRYSMLQRIMYLCILSLFLLNFHAEVRAKENVSVDQSAKIQIQETYGKLPLYFIQNDGQVDEKVKFYEKGSGHATFFTKEGVSISLNNTPQSKSQSEVIKLRLLNSNKNPQLIAMDPQEGKINFFKGNESKKWKTNIPTYLSVMYKEVYKGVDVKYYGNNSQIEYDIIVKPGADPSKVAFSYDGIKGLKVLENGDLEIALNEGSIIQKKPYIYQEINGKRIEVNGKFVIPEHISQNYSYGFDVASYNKDHNLIIDPVIVYSTYIGGNGSDEGGRGMFLDSAGNVYITGETFSTDFPLAGTYSGNGDGFVTKINSSGSGIVFSTYLGGSLYDRGTRLTVDSSGNIYLTGFTSSVDFPTSSPLQTIYGGGLFDAFVTKLNPSGSIIYSTYLGGSGDDYGRGVGLDTTTGAVYVSGGTDSINFPTFAAIQASLSGVTDAFITKIDSSGSSLVFSTFWGGSDYDETNYMAVSSVGNIYITGQTNSIDFPILYPVQPVNGGIDGDAFVSVIDPSGGSVVFSTYLGGSGNDYGTGIAVDSTGAAYVTGSTLSLEFPLLNAVQPYYGGGSINGDVFAAKINYGGGLAYSTYLGGTYDDYGSQIVVDSSGAAYISGYTYSYDFPIVNPLQGYCGGCSTYSDFFITKINPAGTGLEYSTYLGGSNIEFGGSIAVDSAGNAYVAGRTFSTDFPTASPIQGSCASCPATSDTFLTKISPAEPPVSDIVISTAALIVDGTSVAFDGTNYLVVWNDERSGISDIYGRLISPSGAAVSGEFVISSTTNHKYNPRVSFGGGNYLVVWEDYRDSAGVNSDVYGQIVSPAGSPIGLEISISNNVGTNQSLPALEFDGTQFLVVWGDDRTIGEYDIYGRFVTPAGTLAGTRFAINTYTGHQERPRIKFNGFGYLVVWEDFRSGISDVYGQLVSVSGTLNGLEIDINPSPGAQKRPIVDSDGSNFFVVWADYRSTTRADIYAQILTSSGTLAGAEIPVLTTNVPQRITRGVVFNGIDRYLLLWVDRGTIVGPYINRRVNGQFITTAGSLIGSAFEVTANAIDRHSSDVAFDGTNYLAVWVDNRNVGDNDVFGRLISGGVPVDNTPVGSAVVVTPAPDITLNFDTVTTSGNTTVTTSTTGNPPPSGFNLGNSPLYYEVTTTATFTGLINVCFNYNEANYGNENLLRLFHFSGSVWVDITSPGYPDTLNNVMCGTTSSLSPFIIAEATPTTGADLSITKMDLPDPVPTAGNNLTYTITVTNNGPDMATVVTVTDTLPASVTLVSATPSQGAPCTGTNTISCGIGTLLNGSSATVEIVVTTTASGMIGNTASVFGNEADPNTANNSATQTTNVGDVSRASGISTRGKVETGTNIMVGGFTIVGAESKKVLIRGRGPSMSGAPYNFTGTLTNPILEIYSGPTLFAVIDDWQSGATMCNAPAVSCGTPAELQAASVDPCQPNAGQTTAPLGCNLEAAMYITLPPGAYTAKLKGVNSGMGKGIVEVYDPDMTTLTNMGGISTRGKVLTGTDIMVGGFIISGGTSSKKVLLRGRGPSMSGAPYNFTGTLPNPILEIYSGATLFASVDDWQSGAAMCNAPAVSCGTPAELQILSIDPCQPNAGQTTAPPSCNLESALIMTLPPGAYTAKLKGVNNSTGIGIVEVYEVSP